LASTGVPNSTATAKEVSIIFKAFMFSLIRPCGTTPELVRISIGARPPSGQEEGPENIAVIWI
jgi:hypothetical protein